MCAHISGVCIFIHTCRSGACVYTCTRISRVRVLHMRTDLQCVFTRTHIYPAYTCLHKRADLVRVQIVHVCLHGQIYGVYLLAHTCTRSVCVCTSAQICGVYLHIHTYIRSVRVYKQVQIWSVYLYVHHAAGSGLFTPRYISVLDAFMLTHIRSVCLHTRGSGATGCVAHVNTAGCGRGHTSLRAPDHPSIPVSRVHSSGGPGSPKHTWPSPLHAN